MAWINDLPHELTIAIGDTLSTEINHMEQCECIGIYGPASLDAPITIEVSPVATGNEWFALRSGATVVDVDVSECVVLTETPFKRLRAVQGVAASVIQTIKVIFQEVR